jgi:hypothetical protein
MLMTVVRPDSEKLPRMSFRCTYSTCNSYEQAYRYVFNESSKLSDGRTDT